MSLLRKLVSQEAGSHGFRHFTLLAGLAVFFALRSCEYLKVQRGDKVECRTLPIRAIDITFWKNGRKLDHSDPFLHLADSVSIVFRFQKNDGRNEVVTMMRSGDATFCPVVISALLVRATRRLVALGLASADTELFNYLDANGKVAACNTKMCLEFLRNFVALNNPDSLGLGVQRIGLHSLRATAAMAMYLAHVPVFTIMLVGRWRSLAFLSYIRKQVDQFTDGVSACMLTVDHFRTVSSQRGTSASAIPNQTEERTLDALAGQAIPQMGSNVTGPIAFDTWRA